MRAKIAIASLTALALAGLSAAAALRQDPDMMPKPGPEHAIVMGMAGTWETTVTMNLGPTPEVSKGTYVAKPLGGFWLLGEFSGSFMGMDFSGRDITGYDSAKKEYVSVWVDTSSPDMGIMRGGYDAATTTFTFKGPGKDPMTGREVEMTGITQMVGTDKMVYRMKIPGVDGKLSEMMSIEYVRKK